MAYKVLIVDDASFMRMMIKNILSTEADFEVVGEAENGVQAVELYQQLNPDIVTMDITMPELDGIEALKLIKGINADAKVVMCSAMGQQAMVLEAIKSGAKDFVVKPFQAPRVLDALRKVLS